MWGLNKLQAREAIDDLNSPSNPMYGRGAEAIIQATLRHVYEEGEKPCPHYPISEWTEQCDVCWAELKHEAEL